MMRSRTKRNAQPQCICEDIPVGTILNYDVDSDRLKHLHYLVSGNLWLDEPYICPYTGIIWLSRYVEGRDWRVDDIVYERTRHRQPQLENYTVSKAILGIYHEKRLKKDVVSGSVGGVPLSTMEPKWPRFPVVGLLFDLFTMSEENRIAWHYEEIMIEAVHSIQLWVYLPSPLWQGDSSWCWLASPFEPITQQVLRPGLVLEWWFAEGQIGEVRVEAQEQVPASEFFEWFGFDKPYRDTGEEFSAWLREARRGKRRG